MAEYTGTFETGVDGNNVLATDPGSLTQWSDRTLSGTSTITYSSIEKYGTLSGRILLDAVPNVAYLRWLTAIIGSNTTVYGRVYMFLPAGHDVAVTFVRGLDGSRAWELALTAGQKVEVRDQGGTIRGTSVASISNNQWTRVEFKVVSSPTAGVVEAKLYNDANSSTPTETITSTGSFSTLTATSGLEVGVRTSGKASATYYFDNILLNNTGYPGEPSTDVMLVMGMLGTGRV